MQYRTLLFLAIMMQFLYVRCQDNKNHFRLSVINKSGFTTTCNIPGNDKTDSVSALQTKNILFDLDNDQISFYLNLSTKDPSLKAYKSSLIRILNTEKSKLITVTENNQLQYELTPAEKIIADVKPQLRTKNFWKLDSVISSNKNNIAAAEIIYLSLCDIDVKADTIRNFYNRLAPKVKASVFGKRIIDYLDSRTRLYTGSNFSNFTLPDTSGKPVSLNDIKSDFILLDFWFSKCGPCIKSFPDLQNLYAKTSRKDFEIIGISVDTKTEKELWKSTIEKYGLTWINTNDIKSTLPKKLAIVNYPTKILIDLNRKILLVDTDNSYSDFYREIEKIINAK